MFLANEDKRFCRDVAWAIAGLACSALFLFAIFLVYAITQLPDGADTPDKRITGAQLTARIGTSRIDGEAVVVTALKTSHHMGEALLSHHTTFRAESYPYLSFRFDGLNRGQNLRFIWRTARNPGQLYSMLMPRRFAGRTTFNQAVHPEWRGTITEVGVHLQGELRGEPLVIPELIFETHGWRNLLATIWTEWTGFKGWTTTSINFLKGTPGLIQQETLSPTLAVAAWAGGALLFLYLIGRKTNHHRVASCAAATLIPWIILDQFWQRDLSSQLSETRFLFNGKSMHERHLSDIDGHLYQYAKRLKEQVLPLGDQRIFILHESEGHNFERLKAQYYLLPHNIFNYGRFPHSKASRPGDYILRLGQISGLEYESGDKKLTWGDNEHVRVGLVDQDELGSLFIVLGETTGKSASSTGATPDG